MASSEIEKESERETNGPEPAPVHDGDLVDTKTSSRSDTGENLNVKLREDTLDSNAHDQGMQCDSNLVDNRVDDATVVKEEDGLGNESVVERKEEEAPMEEPLEYCTEQDLIESDSESKDETQEQRLLRLYREMPARVYLEKTRVIQKNLQRSPPPKKRKISRSKVIAVPRSHNQCVLTV